jgi:hypothetical protein
MQGRKKKKRERKGGEAAPQDKNPGYASLRHSQRRIDELKSSNEKPNRVAQNKHRCILITENVRIRYTCTKSQVVSNNSCESLFKHSLVKLRTHEQIDSEYSKQPAIRGINVYYLYYVHGSPKLSATQSAMVAP